ncbi:MAG: PadR family transcriptional regulator [Oscillospiraceae bacterium]|nr:PadR family transcriptional regulator [Oscillospiraceae bacterium]
MASDNLRSGFQRGAMAMIILSLLKYRDMYGYQLVQEIEKQSDGVLVTQEGSLYPVLYKLQDQGCISDKKVLVGRRMVRVYYHIEDKGLQHLQDLTQEYESVTQGIYKIIKGEVEKI